MAYASWTKFTERVRITGGSMQRLDADTGLPIIAPDLPSYTQPSILNTGHTTALESLVAYSGPTTITVDDTVIEGCIITNQIAIQANNVIIRDCLITQGGLYGVRADYGYTGLLVESTEITGMTSAAVFGENLTVQYCYLHDTGNDGVKAKSNCTVRYNLITMLGTIDTAHADGVQLTIGSNVFIYGNFFDMLTGITVGEQLYKNSQCVLAQADDGVIDNLQVYNNWIRGGIIAVQIRDKGTGFGYPTNCTVINNIYYVDSWQSAPFLVENTGAGLNQNRVYGNRTFETGELLAGQEDV